MKAVQTNKHRRVNGRMIRVSFVVKTETIDVWAKVSTCALAREHSVDGRRHDEREQERDGQAAYDGDGERLQKLRARADCQREREHSEYRGERSHKHGPEATTARTKQSLTQCVALFQVFLDGVEHQYAVLRDDA